MKPENPLIIQSDHTMMLEVEHPRYTDCRDFLVVFAELEKSPEFIHTYKVTPLSLWNAASTEISLTEIIDDLHSYSKYDIPANVVTNITEWYNAYGKLVLQKSSSELLFLEIKDARILKRIVNDDLLRPYYESTTENGLLVLAEERGNIKQAFIKAGYPIKDICGYITGEPFDISLRLTDIDGNEFGLRDYQTEAVNAFYHSGRKTGGNGVIVLPCGSGKTIIGLGTIASLKARTLIITTNNVSVHQWRDELLSKTDIDADDIGEYTGVKKEVKPITITTYQMLTYRPSKDKPLENLQLFDAFDWGFIIYDEVHLLPAPVFSATANIQGKRRLGLTATLIREDGKEDDVFALIGPKRFDVPWKVLEKKGYIAEALCTEYRIELPEKEEIVYAHAPKRQQFRIAAENSMKIEIVKELIINHPDDSVLVIGQFITQLQTIQEALEFPIITGKTKHEEREKLYTRFRKGDIKVLIVSKVANFAVDLPDASVLIQVSGTFGSRQEEAQRLGRILRPKKKRSHFYTIVSRNTEDQRFSINRQLFLVEQGYKYHIQYID